MSTATAAPAIDQRVALTFATRGQDDTTWIEIEYPTDNVPQALLDDLAAIGFAPDGMRQAPPVEKVTYDMVNGAYTMVRHGYSTQEIVLSKRGSGLFAGWTPAEKRSNMTAARRVLRAHGFATVPVWRKTLQDML